MKNKVYTAIFTALVMMVLFMPKNVEANADEPVSISAIEKVNEGLNDRVTFEYFYDDEQEMIEYTIRTLHGENPKLIYAIEEKEIERKEAHKEYEDINEEINEILEVDDASRKNTSILIMLIPMIAVFLVLFVM